MRSNIAPGSALLLLALSACAASLDGGVLQQPALDPRGASLTVRGGMGGGAMRHSRYLVAFGPDTRVDVASGGSRWTIGASLLGGVRLGPVFPTARAGIWRAIVSSTDEAAVVPSFELGAYIPLHERFDPNEPKYGSSSGGLVVGMREDLDEVSYLTVFVGYAGFLVPGY